MNDYRAPAKKRQHALAVSSLSLFLQPSPSTFRDLSFLKFLLSQRETPRSVDRASLVSAVYVDLDTGTCRCF